MDDLKKCKYKGRMNLYGSRQITCKSPNVCEHKGLSPYGMMCWENQHRLTQKRKLNANRQEAIESSPTVDAAPVVRGKWVDNMDCSICGFTEITGARHSNYCPRCGANMQVVTE
jgi:hypothetical protein